MKKVQKAEGLKITKILVNTIILSSAIIALTSGFKIW